MCLAWPFQLSLMPPFLLKILKTQLNPANDAEDPRDGLEALVDNGEAHEVGLGTLNED